MAKFLGTLLVLALMFIGFREMHSSKPVNQPVQQQDLGLQALPGDLGNMLKDHAKTLGEAEYVGMTPEGQLVVVLGKGVKRPPQRHQTPAEPGPDPEDIPPGDYAPGSEDVSYLSNAIRAIMPGK